MSIRDAHEPYSLKATLFAIAITFVVLAAASAAVLMVTSAAATRSAKATPTDDVVRRHAEGMPLDAISFDAPAWMPDCREAYKIYDRQSGDAWWVLVTNQSDVGYVVLPIGGNA